MPTWRTTDKLDKDDGEYAPSTNTAYNGFHNFRGAYVTIVHPENPPFWKSLLRSRMKLDVRKILINRYRTVCSYISSHERCLVLPKVNPNEIICFVTK